MAGAATQSFRVSVPPDFDLAAAVCSYGWALLAPNRWIKASTSKLDGLAAERSKSYAGAFERPLRTSSGQVVTALIKQESRKQLYVSVAPATTDSARLEQQVIRMLRLTAADCAVAAEFQSKHAAAKARNFGRLLRSPTAWEDIVKCILLCNCGWGRSVTMNAALCDKVGGGGFPTPDQVATWQPDLLQAACGLGYRAKHIVKLAKQVAAAEVDLAALEDDSASDAELLSRLRALPGLGPFSAANMLQLLGRYSTIACDSETVRHLRARRGRSDCTAANCAQMAAKVYEEYAPHQFLAYWFELWEDYEQLLGPIAELDPELYNSFTGNNMKKNGRNGKRATEEPTEPQKRTRSSARQK